MDVNTDVQTSAKPIAELSVEQMAEKILETVKHYGAGTSFVDLEHAISKPMQGDFSFHLPNKPNSILWDGVSELFIDGLLQALDTKKIVPKPSIFLLYAMDGKFLNLPVGTARKKDYRKPHWIPCVLSPAEEKRKAAPKAA
jgi:hypothetical protein